MSSPARILRPGTSRGPEFGADRRWRRAALGVALAVPMLAIVDFGGNDARDSAAFTLLVLAATAVVLWLARHHPAAGRPPAFAFPLLGLNLLFALQWRLGWSAYSGMTLNGWEMYAAATCLFFLACAAFRLVASYDFAARLLFAFSGLLGVEAVAQAITSPTTIYWFKPAAYGMPAGPFVYHNDFAACVELLLPLAVSGAFLFAGRRADWAVKMLVAIVPASLLVALVLSKARGGVISIAFECIVGLALMLASPARRRLMPRALLVGGFCLALTLAAGWGPLLARFQAPDPGAGDYQRPLLVRSSLAMWRAHPWLGSGLDTYETVYPRFRLYDSGKIVDHAHCDVLEWLAENGAIGGLLLAGALGLGLIAAARSIQATMATSTATWKWAAVVGCSGFLFHCCFDFVGHCTAVLLLFCLMAGMAVAMPGPEIATAILPMRRPR